MIPAEAVAKVWPFLSAQLERKMTSPWSSGSVRMEGHPEGLGVGAWVEFRHGVRWQGVTVDEVLDGPPLRRS